MSQIIISYIEKGKKKSATYDAYSVTAYNNAIEKIRKKADKNTDILVSSI